MLKNVSASLSMIAALCAVSVPPAHAAPYQLGTYYEDTAEATCPSLVLNCILSFAIFPSTTNGQWITLTEISCYTYTSQSLFGGTLYVSDAGSNRRRPHYIEGPETAGASYFRRELDFKIQAGPPRQPVLYFVASSYATYYANCTIVGTLSTQ